MKQLQFELWQECNSHCSFCYLGKENQHTLDSLKLNSLKNALDKISDLSIYKEYDTISYLGGEFFQGQLDSLSVRNLFFKLMEKTAWLSDNGYIKNVWIYATMTIGDQSDLYNTVKLFKDKSKLWILTSYDTEGRFHTPLMLKTWDSTMRSLHILWPTLKFNITSILTQDLINKYISGELSFKKMMEEYHCSFFFKQCGSGGLSKADFIKSHPHFFPSRDSFLKFLTKFHNEESDTMWSKLFDIHYRADTLFRNYNDPFHQMELNVRHKDSKVEESVGCRNSQLSQCGHLINYAAYSDSSACVLCDKEMIDKL